MLRRDRRVQTIQGIKGYKRGTIGVIPVKGQARGKIVDTIETSSEKITLNLQRKNN